MTHKPSDRFDDWAFPDIADGKLTEYNWVVHGSEHFVLEEYVDIGAFTVINAHAGVRIETDVQIGPHCDIHSKSTIDGTEGEVVIRQGACIGSHTTILPGVEIGSEAVVGSHSLIKQDVPENGFVTGIPASDQE